MTIVQCRVPSLLSLCCSIKNVEQVLEELPVPLRLDPILMCLLPIASLMQFLSIAKISLDDAKLTYIWLQRLEREFFKNSPADRPAYIAYFEALTMSCIIGNDSSKILTLQSISSLPVRQLCLHGQHIAKFPTAKIVLPSFRMLTHLEFRWIKPCHLKDFCDMLDLASSNQSLEHFSLTDCLLNDGDCATLIKHIPLTISSLLVSNAALGQLSLRVVEARLFPLLRSIVLDESGVEFIPLSQLATAFLSVTRLESITLNPAPNCLLNMPLNLISLSLDYEESDEVMLQVLVSMTDLRRLRLANIQAWRFQLPPYLNDLTLYQCGITASNIESVLSTIRFDSFSSLDLSQNRLDRASCPILQSLISQSCHSLQRLSLSGCGFVPDTGFMETVAASQIVDLNLSHNNMGDDALPAVASLIRRLSRPFERLDISSNRIKSVHFLLPIVYTIFLKMVDIRWNLLSSEDSVVRLLRNVAEKVVVLPSALNLVCDAMQATSWADSKMTFGSHPQ